MDRMKQITVIKQKGKHAPFNLTGGDGDAVIVRSVTSELVMASNNSALASSPRDLSSSTTTDSTLSSTRQNFGLFPGSEIHRINGIPVDSMPLPHILTLINACSRLELLVSVPSLESMYEWSDMNGAVVPPPPASYLTRLEHPAYNNRWVCLKTDVEELKGKGNQLMNKSLGLVIRGGSEYGLGIFVSKIDPDSIASLAGLKTGDQIVNVNGYDFRIITHSQAVSILRSFRRLQMLVRYLGKLPEADKNHPGVNGCQQSTHVETRHQVSVRSNGVQSPQTSVIMGNTVRGSRVHLASGKVPINRVRRRSDDKLTRSSAAEVNMTVDPNAEIRQVMQDVGDYMSRENLIQFCESLDLYVNNTPNVSIDTLMERINGLLNSTNRLIVFDRIRSIIRSADRDRYENYLLRMEIKRLRKSISALDLRCRSHSQPVLNEITTVNETDLPARRRPRNTQARCISKVNGIRDASCEKVRRQLKSPALTVRSGNTTECRYSPSSQDNECCPAVSATTSVDDTDIKYARTVLVEKCKPFLGIAIEGGSSANNSSTAYSVFPKIVYLHPEGAAYISSQLAAGNMIMAVDNQFLGGLGHRAAAEVISSQFRKPKPGWIQLVVINDVAQQ